MMVGFDVPNLLELFTHGKPKNGEAEPEGNKECKKEVGLTFKPYAGDII